MNRSLFQAARIVGVAAPIVLAALAETPTAAVAASYFETDLVSDLPGRALVQDPGLVNPWGISFAVGGPFWLSDNGSGLTTLYRANGAVVPLVVTIPPAPGGSSTVGSPTGQVFSGTSGFQLAPGKTATFTFASEDGTISGWNPTVNATNAIIKVDNSTKGLGSVYKGLAIASSGGANELFAADFRNGTVDVFDSLFAPVILGAGAFADPALPPGFAPFNIANIGGKLFVTYALQDAAKHDDVAGAGNGFVDVFNPDGTFVERLISGGVLDSPWGIALAPATFGEFSNDLLVGNFGDGSINAFDPGTGALLGTLSDEAGSPISIDGLWGLSFRPDLAGEGSTLFFTAGLNDEADGLFGAIAVPEPSTITLMGIAMVAALRVRRPRRSSTSALAMAAT